MSHKLYSEKFYSNYSEKILQGTSKEWYEGGQLCKEVDYINGKLNGRLLVFWENGLPKRLEYYSNNQLLEGDYFNKEGAKIDSVKNQIMPRFPGGTEELKNYLIKIVTYPTECIKKEIQGSVVTSFDVNESGKISNISIANSSSNQLLDKEALRVISNMPFWEPARNGIEFVKVHFFLPIKFSLK